MRIARRSRQQRGSGAPGRLLAAAALIAALVAILSGPPARAFVAGSPPGLLATHSIFGDARAIGATLMLPGPAGTEIRSVLLGSAPATLSNLPADAVLEGVYVFWSGSLAQDGVSGPKVADTQVTLTVADGTSFTVNASPGACSTVTHPTEGTSFPPFFYCRANVTAQVTPHKVLGSYNGVYSVGGVNADPGHINAGGTCVESPPRCQAKYAAWSMVVIYRSPTETLQRDIRLYDGFLVVDHQDGVGGSLGQTSFVISNFLADANPLATLSYFAVESDAQLGQPPQDLYPPSHPFYCSTCQDFVRFNGVTIQDDKGWPGNIFNESLGAGSGVDIDSIDVSSLVTPGATQATITIGSGTGPVLDPPPVTGGGELFGYGWTLLSLKRPAPNFKTPQTNKAVNPTSAGQGEQVAYTVNVTNAGSLPATNTVVRDTLPTTVTYRPGSLQVNGTPCTDAADADACTVVGNTITVRLGTVAHQPPNNSRQISFFATVSPSATNGQVICNAAQITSNETPTPHSTNNACFTVQAPELDTPTKADVDLDGAPPEPDDIIQFNVAIRKLSSGQASAIRFVDDMPRHLQLLSVVVPPGATDNSVLGGGANGTGRVDISDITIPANLSSVNVTILAQVDSVSEFAAQGVGGDAIDNRQLCNQGQVTAPFLSGTLATDDPAVGGNGNPTCFRLVYRPNLSTSTKAGADVDGGLLEPGDQLRYTITLRNTGNRPATVNLTDDLPPHSESFSLQGTVPGAVYDPPPAGAHGSGRLRVTGLVVPASTTREIVFTVNLANDVPDGTAIQNCSAYVVAEPPNESRSICSTTLNAFARPDLERTSKTVTDVDGGAVNPGDQLSYTITIANAGNRPATSVVLTDVIDASLTDVVPLDGGSYNAATRTITWNIGTIPAGGPPLTRRFTARVVSPLANGTAICNQGQVASAELATEPSDDPATPASDDPTCVTVVSAPDFSTMSKTVGDTNGAPTRPGDTLSYTITLPNTGTETATNTVVTDVVDANLTQITPLDGGSYNATTRTISWTVGSLAPGSQAVLRFTARVSSPLINGTVIANQAFARATQVTTAVPSDDPTTPTLDDPTRVTVTSAADLGTSVKTVSDVNGGVPQPGDLLQYTIIARNSGDAPARDTVIGDVVAANLTQVTPLDGGSYNAASRTITWPAATVVPGTDRMVRFSARLLLPLPNGTVVCNQAQLTSTDVSGAVLTDDPATPTADDPTCVTVLSRPDLGGTIKTALDVDGGQLEPGDVVRYTITVDNIGTENASGVVLTDVVDANLTQITPLDGGSYNSGNRTITWNVGDVPAKSQLQRRFEATVATPLDDGTTISNQALVVGTGLPAVSSDDPSTPAVDDPTVLTVRSAPRFTSSTKTVVDPNGGLVEPGDQLDFTLTLRNSGNSRADQLVVTDVLDANLELVSAGQGGQYDAATRTVSWNATTTPALAQLDPGAAHAVTLTLSARVRSPLANGTVVCNQGQINSDELSAAQPTDNPSTPAVGDPTCVTVSSAPDLSGVTKTVAVVGGGPARPGSTLSYTIILSNTGNEPATDLAVVDTVDASLENAQPGQGGLYQPATRVISWNPTTTPALASLAPGANITLTFTAVVTKPLDDGTVIANQAAVVGANLPAPSLSDDPGTPAVDDPTRITVAAAADLSTSQKTVVDLNGGDVEPGDTLRWTITLKNTGDALAKQVSVSDVVDANLDNVVVLDGGSYNAATRTISWGVPQVGLSPTDDVQLRFTSRVVTPLANQTWIANQATITIPGVPAILSDDPGTPQVDDPTRVRVTSTPDLSTMTKSVSGAQPDGTVAPGTVLTYTIELANTGSEDALNVLVTDEVDANLTAVAPLDGGSYNAATRVVSWAIPQLKVGERVTLRFTASVKNDAKNETAIANQAFAERAGVPGSRVPSDNPATPQLDDPTTVTVRAVPDLEQLTKEVRDDNGGDVVPGDTLSYTLVVRNSGNAFAFNVVVTDPVPTQHLEAVTPGEGGSFTPQNGTISWSATTTPALAQIAPGEQVTLTFTARVKVPTADGTPISNQARVAADGTQIEPSDDPATAAADDPTVVRVVAKPRLTSSTKRAIDRNGGLLRPGDELEYVIRVVNDGSTNATGVRLVDPIPAYTTYVGGSTRLNGAAVGDSGQSPLAAGLLVSSVGQPPGVVAVGDNNAAEVRFRVRVKLATQEGTIVSNQGLINSAEVPLAVTDDPATATVGDPTQVVVGAGPNLNNTTKTYGAKPVGDNGNDRFDPGEVIAYRVTIPNTGTAAATNVVFTDPLDPQGRAVFVPGTLALDGRPLTGAADGDAGSVAGNKLRVVVGRIAAGARAVISYQALISSGPQVVNQGRVASKQLQPVLTDADGNDGNGDTPTVVPVGAGTRNVSVVKQVKDVNGAEVQPGDELLYTLTLTNGGVSDERVDIVDDLPAGTTLVPGSVLAPPGTTTRSDPAPAGANGRGRVAVRNIALAAGTQLTIALRVRLDGDLERGSSVCNSAKLSGAAGIDLRDSAPACVLIGSPAGTGALSGVVFRDIGADNRTRDAGDQLLAGLQVQALLLGDPNGTPAASAVSDEKGRFDLGALPPGPYALRVLTGGGAQLATLSAVVVRHGQRTGRDIPVDPSGIVYNSVTGKAVANARVTLYYDADDGLAAAEKVPEARLGHGQQDQVTDASGFYKFDVPAGRKYRVAVAPLSSSLQFVSSLIPPADGFAKVGPEREVVPDDVPDPKQEGANLTYYLRFDVRSAGDEVFNNHIPVDPLSSLIRLEKRSDRRRASLGDLVTYTVTVENRSTRDFLLTGRRVGIEDVLPRGLRFVRRTVRRVRRLRPGRRCLPPEVERRDVDGQTVCYDGESRATSKTGRVLRFGPFPLGAGESVRLIYQVLVGLDTKQGVYRNLAVLKDEGWGSEISNRDEARLTVQPDPDLDQGLLLGKVFCDGDGDGRQDRGERGVPGARVYLDNGSYAVTDLHGKYHLRDIDPGLHLVKIDSNTLRPGSGLTTEEARVIQFTRGLPAKVNFGVRCRENWVRVQQLVKARKKGKKRQKRRARRKAVVPTLSLAGDVPALRVSRDGRALPLFDVDLAVADPRRRRPLGRRWDKAAPVSLPPVARGGNAVLFNMRARGRPARGWRLTVWRATSAGARQLVRRFSGAGHPPAQLAWDGRSRGRKTPLALSAGAYAAQLEVIGLSGSGGRSPLRPFGVGLRGPVPRLTHTAQLARLDGRPLKLDRHGRFVTSVGRPDRRSLELRLRRGDGKSSWITLNQPPPIDDEPTERLLVSGNLAAATLAVDGKRVDTSMLRVELGAAPVKVDRRGRLAAPIRWRPRFTSALVQSWRLRISDAGGRTVRVLSGPLPVPPTIAWDGTDAAGKLLARPGARFVGRLTLIDARGNLGQSPARVVKVPAGRAFAPLKVTARRLFSARSGKLLRYRPQLSRALRQIRRRPASERYRLEIRVAPPARWQSERWAGLIRAVRRGLERILRRYRIAPRRVRVVVNAAPLPASPVVPRGRRRTAPTDRRREVLRLTTVPPTPLVSAKPTPLLRIDGARVKPAKDGSFRLRAAVQLGTALVVELRDGKGHRAVLLVPTAAPRKVPTSRRPTGAPPARVAGAVARRALAPVHRILRMRGGGAVELRLARAPGSASRPASAPASGLARREGATTAGPASAPSSAPASTGATSAPAAGAPAASAPATAGDADARLRSFGRDVLRRSFGGPRSRPASRPAVKADVAAAELRVDLPPRGALLKSHQLTLRGETHPDNKVTINGKKVRLLPGGRFVHTVKLPDGKSQLVIKSQDKKGNVGVIRWPVRVSDRAMFLMALAEGAIGQPGVELAGDNDHSRLSSDKLLLRGRAVLYLKARIKGKYLFKRYTITAHVDSAKKREFEDFFDQVVDPNRYYPIYGDSAKHVRDVNARDKYYVMVQADDSSLRVGNFHANLKGIQLLRYDRALYGAKLDLRKALIKKKLAGRIKAFYSRDDARLARDHNVLRATGGSIYYLRHGQVLEGSERVRLVVRERNTGLQLASVIMTRDTDYRIDYPGGRLLFASPVSSVADAGFTASNPAFTLSTLSGHPVFVEVDYQYEADRQQNKSAWGAQAKTTLFDVLTIGGTFVSEQRADGVGGDYRLYGGDLTYRFGKGTKVTAEFARSESYNAFNFISEDGGITYLALNQVAQQSADPRADDANAYQVAATVEFSDFIKRLKAGALKAHGYFSRTERGFFSGGTILDQGRTKYGGRLDWAFGGAHQLTLRHDGALALLPQLPVTSQNGLDPLQMREVQSELTRLRYRFKRKRWQLGAELSHMFMRDATTIGLDSHRSAAAVQASYRLTRWLRLIVGQDAIFYASGVDPQLGTGAQIGLGVSAAGDWADRLMTTIGAEIAVGKRVALQLLETVRWSGDNATSIGLKSKVSDSTAAYVRQVFGTIDDKFNTVTVVGAEERFGAKKSGRTYGEYQLDSGAHGRRNRAILGLTNKWSPWRGISFAGGFEHQQVFGARLPDGTPVGDSQRDVVHIGFEYLRPRRLKLSTRAELRFDSATGVQGLLGSGGFSPKWPGVNGANVDPRAGFGPGTYADRTINPGTQLNLTPGERWQILTRNAATLAVTEDISLLARLNYYRTYNTTEDLLEAEALEVSFGAALRPVRWDWLNVLFKYTHILEMRPISLTEHLSRRRDYDVLSLSAIVDLPWRLELVEKFAYKRVHQQLDVLAGETLSTVAHTLLWINRLNLHLIGRLDAGVEYRLMRILLDEQGDQLEHGALLELGYWLHRFVRLGAGYNFTSFSDNEFADQDRDASGFFFRVVGRY